MNLNNLKAKVWHVIKLLGGIAGVVAITLAFVQILQAYMDSREQSQDNQTLIASQQELIDLQRTRNAMEVISGEPNGIPEAERTQIAEEIATTNAEIAAISATITAQAVVGDDIRATTNAVQAEIDALQATATVYIESSENERQSVYATATAIAAAATSQAIDQAAISATYEAERLAAEEAIAQAEAERLAAEEAIAQAEAERLAAEEAERLAAEQAQEVRSNGATWRQVAATNQVSYVINPLTKDIYEFKSSIPSLVKIGGPGSMFAIDNQGRLFGLTPNKAAIYMWTGVPEQWTKVGGPAGAIYAGGHELVATNPDSGDIYRYNGQPNNWTLIGGPGSMFAIDNQGRLFGLTPNKAAIYMWTGVPEQWTKVGGPAGAIYAGGHELVATNPDSGDIYRYNGQPNNWTLIGGPGSMFAIDNQGRLFGLTPNKAAIYMWTGVPEQWIKVGGPAGAIYAGGNELYATNPDTGDVYKYEGVPMNWIKAN